VPQPRELQLVATAEQCPLLLLLVVRLPPEQAAMVGPLQLRLVPLALLLGLDCRASLEQSR
jgi:hypothetical protein